MRKIDFTLGIVGIGIGWLMASLAGASLRLLSEPVVHPDTILLQRCRADLNICEATVRAAGSGCLLPFERPYFQEESWRPEVASGNIPF